MLHTKFRICLLHVHEYLFITCERSTSDDFFFQSALLDHSHNYFRNIEEIEIDRQV